MSSFLEKLKEDSIEDLVEEKKTEKKKVKHEEKEPVEQLAKETLPEEKINAQLSIDVYETEESLIIQSTIAGIKVEDLDISLENNILTIKGERKRQEENEIKNYFYKECYWGQFQRQLILPTQVDGLKVQAVIKDGVLILKIPKIRKEKKRKISIKEEK
ncbi:MAG: Hsp20/alpha crystallin family protein [Candidatus Parcubacteria bacterium]|nr:Hsp20/alpha crystallin family protein [Candidatus Parcubacteria bacterium]